MHQQENCIFCQIVLGKASCHRIHEDELTLTFLDAFPATPGHLLIVTKEHFADIFDAKPKALARVAENAKIMANIVQRVLNPDGLGIYQFNKAAAGQTVFHYHMHLIPQITGSNIGIHSKSAADPEQLATLGKSLRNELSEVNSS